MSFSNPSDCMNMSKNQKHNDPSKKKGKHKKKIDKEPIERSDPIERDYRKVKTLRQTETLPSTFSKTSQKKSTSTSDEAVDENIEGRRHQILRFLTSKIWGRSAFTNEASQTSEVSKQNILKIEKSTSSYHSVSPSVSNEFPTSSTVSSTILEVESEVILPLDSSKSPSQELRNQLDIDSNDNDLINATYLRDLQGVVVALNKGANINAVKDRQTPLLIATECNDLRLVSYFVKIKNLDLNYRDYNGENALMIALKSGFDEIAKILIRHGAHVNSRNNIGRTPLHMAIFHSKVELAKLLIAYGADYEVADCFGERPMYTCSVKRPNIECLNLLLEAGAAPDYYHITGISLLSRAIFDSTDFEIIERLIESGADVNYRDFYSGKTPLHVAAAVNNLSIVKLLLDNGADPNVETKYGYTPYDQAIFHRSLEVAQYLAQITEDAKWGLLTELQKKTGNSSLIFKE